MFNTKTEKILALARKYPAVIKELENVFDNKTNVYIDFANVIRWQEKINWHIDFKRLKQLFDSFNNINSIKFYSGTLVGDDRSEKFIEDIRKMNYDVHTKPVKIMKLSIDVSSIPINSPALLGDFIRKPLLKEFNLETIEILNEKLKELNDRGIKFIQDKKCNFDVEIGRDMLIDYDKNKIENFILWSGDSDFSDPINQLLKDGKRVVVFATARRVSTEISDTGVQIFEIKKIRDFICWPKESQKDSFRSP
jgi:uncharacterized LabA/DUF88 family protein